VQELQQHTKHLIIALDADATGNAFALARKWGRAFDSCKVLVLKQDIKDMPLSDLTSLNL
jgi:orotidine-5'-phosphate decarboxylase